MYINSIENLPHNLNSKTTANKIMMGVHSTLTNTLLKCNYMEYIEENKNSLELPLKGTSWAFSTKGTSECEIILDTVILKLLDFLNYHYYLLSSFKALWCRGLLQKVKHLTTYLTLSIILVWGLTNG